MAWRDDMERGGGFRGSYGRERGEFVGDGRHPREWWGGYEGPHTGRGPKDYRRSDERIQEEACDVLTRHGHIDATNIQVRVENGEITLEGAVNSRQEKRLTERVLENLSGVRDVHNRLRVEGNEGHGRGQDEGFLREAARRSTHTGGSSDRTQTEGRPEARDVE
jgi:BON domain